MNSSDKSRSGSSDRQSVQKYSESEDEYQQVNKRTSNYSAKKSKSLSASRSRSFSYSRSRSRSRSYEKRRKYRSRSRSRSRRRSRSPYNSGRYNGRDRYRYNRRRRDSRSFSRSRSRSPISRRRRHVADRDNPPKSKCLGVFGLSLHTRERELSDIFGRYGEVKDVQLVYDNYSGLSRGFAFIYFASAADAGAAKDRAHGIELDGRNIRCDFSLTNRAHTPTPGVYLGKPSRRRSPRSPNRHRSRYSRSRSRSSDRRY